MMDLSDGLGSDAGHLAAAGGVRLSISVEQLPVQEGVEAVAVAAGRTALDLTVSGGEDYELLACLPGENVGAARDALESTGTRLTAIGTVEKGDSARLVDANGRELRATGFDHLRPD